MITAINKHRKSLIIAASLLSLCIVFSGLLHSVLNWVLVKPILSTVGSSIWTDFSVLIFACLSAIVLHNVELKKSGPKYPLQAAILVIIVIYLYHRAVGSRYIFTPFSFVQFLNYADILLLLAIDYLALLNLEFSSNVQENIGGKNRPAKNVIKSYITQSSNYALLINGKRGTGKTYFMKNTIQPMIDSTYTDELKTRKYKTIFISLFGAESVDEIYFQLAINMKPYLRHLSVQTGSLAARILARGLMNLSGAGSIEEYITDIKDVTREKAKDSNFVLIFDDMDRMSEKLSVNDFIGFINSMVEHENNKVIIIADEIHLAQKELYNAAREKSIGIVVDFQNDFNNALDDIITVKYKTEEQFKQTLGLLKSDIQKVFKHWKCDNLRILIYFLDHFLAIFKFIEGENNTEDLRLSKLKDTAEYCAVLSIEFLKGAISFRSPNGVDQPGMVNSFLSKRFQIEMFKMMKSRSEQEKKADAPVMREPLYIETFSLNFTLKGHYYFYRSIFGYVTGGDELNKEMLAIELKENVTDRFFVPSEQEMVYQKLSAPGVYDLSNEEYEDLSQRMYKFALEGEYPLHRYTEIFYRLIRFPEIKAFPEKETSELLIRTIRQNKDKFQFDSNMDVQNRHTDLKSYTAYELAIHQAISEVNNSIGVSDSEIRRKSLFDIFENDHEKFYKLCNDDYTQKGVFNTWDYPSFRIVFESMKPSEIMDFKNFIKSRYSNNGETIWVEYDFLSKIFNELRTFHLENQPYTLGQYIEDELSDVLLDIIDRKISKPS